MEAMTTKQAAAAIGVGTQRVIDMIEAGQLRASKFGTNWAINTDDVQAQADRRKGGHLPPGYPAGRPRAAIDTESIFMSIS